MIKKTLIDLIETIIVSLIVIFIIYGTIAAPEKVQGASMEPNFHTGERILVDKISKNFKDFSVGEVVVIHPPENEGISYLKRVIAKSGDVVKVAGCNVYILRNDEKFELDEEYLDLDTCTIGGDFLREGKSLKIGEGEYLVFGDNREHSFDSRSFGVLKKDQIVGRVIFRFWPLESAGYIK